MVLFVFNLSILAVKEEFKNAVPPDIFIKNLNDVKEKKKFFHN